MGLIRGVGMVRWGTVITALLILAGLCLMNACPLKAESKASGLTVEYWTETFIRNINKFPFGSGRRGASISHIDHQFGNGPIFDSGANRGVCVHLAGFINLDKAGRYEFQALSNDGVKIEIDGRVLIVDPDVHSDRLSSTAGLDVTSPGWKRLDIKYFQRKGTAALKFYWKTPGSSSMTIVPAAAYGH